MTEVGDEAGNGSDRRQDESYRIQDRIDDPAIPWNDHGGTASVTDGSEVCWNDRDHDDRALVSGAGDP